MSLISGKKRDTDFTKGPILSSIVVFTLPIFLGNVFQQLYNMVDSIVVGKFVGANALAAVGSSATTSMILVGLMLGFPAGASIIASQFLGAGKPERIKTTISTAMWFLLGLAAVMTILGETFSSAIIRLLNVPENIRPDALLYFRIYVAGIVFMAMYNFFAAFLRALGDSTTPLIFLIISSLLNIAGDLFFVVTLHMGVAGVAIATDLAQMVSVILCFIYCSRKNEYFRFKKGELVFDKSLVADIVRYGLPNSIQSSISGMGMLMVQGLINSFGSVSMAAYTAAAKMEQLCNLPMTSLSLALAVFAGQNIGAREFDRIKKGHRVSLIFVVCVSAAASALIYFFGQNLMLLFVNAEEAEVVEIGKTFMRRWAPFVFLHGMSAINTAFLRGFGDSLFAMISSFSDLGVRMLTAFLFALGLGLGFMGIAWAIPCGWGCCAVVSGLRYLSGRWKNKAVRSAA